MAQLLYFLQYYAVKDSILIRKLHFSRIPVSTGNFLGQRRLNPRFISFAAVYISAGYGDYLIICLTRNFHQLCSLRHLYCL